MAGVAGPGLDLGAEAENELLGLAEARAGALLTRTLEQRRELIRKLQAILKTNEKLDLKKGQLKEILDGLGTYSDTIDDNGEKLLKYIIDQFPTSFTWVKTTMETESTSIKFLNMIRYFYSKLVLPIPKDDLHKRGKLHIVLVGKGRFRDQFHPADWLIPRDSIIDTILYSPWNCCIDAKVAYGIATGGLQPGHRDFRNNQTPIMQPQQVPDDWNSIRAHHQQTVPEIILGPLNGAADLLTQSLDDQIRLYRDHKRFIIPYPPGGDLADWLPEMPLYQIIGVINILLKVIPPYKATIHLAADLKYREPDVERLKDQYAFTPDGTVMTRQDMLLAALQFPALYNLFRSMFDPETPQ